ncbi:MAG: homoserine dehydrogenase [Acidobacteria bacterium]|nr:homoserine dehydrogenase [Acidobacteriota bacterium]
MKRYNLCLLGYGNVGRALVALLVKKSEAMRELYGIEWRITGVATRRMGWLASPEGFEAEALLSGEAASKALSPPPSNVSEWLRAARADVLFENTSLEPHTGEPAVSHVRAALESGAHAITANKGTVVHAYRELNELAREKGRRFMFESTVADCLPVFSLFREDFPAAELLSFSGLLNSTTGIILEEIERGGTFDEGVRRAQAMGVAETNPSYDVDGWDSTVKACAIANVLMNAQLKLEEVQRVGIRNLDAREVLEARAAGRPYKLVARAERTRDGRIKAVVRPEQLPLTDPLVGLDGSSLAVHFELDVLPGLTVIAHNPDVQSTAYGLLADFINAVR